MSKGLDGIALFSNKRGSNQPSSFEPGSLGKYSQAVSSGSPGPPGPYGKGTYKGKNRHLYCDYCKWRGHTRERCYRLHGFPGDSKPKKKHYSANAVTKTTSHDPFQCRNSNEMDQSSQSSNQGGGMMFTQEQYDQILKMLHKEVSADSDKQMASMTQVFMATNSETFRK